MFCAAGILPHTEEGLAIGLSSVSSIMPVVAPSPLLSPHCHAPDAPPATHSRVHAFTSHHLPVTVLVCTLTQNGGTPLLFTMHCPFSGNSESNARLVLTVFLSHLLSLYLNKRRQA